MLIGIDGNEANVKHKVGVHQYAYEILWRLYEENKNRKSQHEIKVFLKEKPRSDLPKENGWWSYQVLPAKALWILTRLTPFLVFAKNKPDVFFTPSHYLPVLSFRPKVCTIHDLGYLEFSEQFKKYDFWQLKTWSAISIIISKYIICVSRATKKDIVRHYHFASGKSKVIHHGYDKKKFNTNVEDKVVRRVKEKYGIKGNYILFLSMLKPSKNIEGLLEAFNKVKKTNPDYKLVIAGKKGWLFNEIFKKTKELNLKKDVIFTGFVSEKDKPALMKGAKVFASPSFWEGFGMHVLEALACGTPVVVSKVASLPEVAGEVGIYVDHDRPQDIARGIKKVLNMGKKEYNELITKSHKQASKFSWDKAGKETFNIIVKAGNKDA